jgi:FkbM family methyltransferase
MKHLTLPTDKELNETSIVLDLGGYIGTYCALINQITPCNIYVFEPIKEYFNHCSERFKNNKNIRVFNFGVGASDDTIQISKAGDSSSAYRTNGDTEECIVRNYREFLNSQKIGFVDVMKINIEGGEYDVLPYLISSGEITSVGKIQVQFHNLTKDSKSRKDEICNDLSCTHELKWSSGEFVWEEWALKC